MQIPSIVESMTNNSEISLRLCNSVTHNRDWYETSSKTCYDIWIMLDGNIQIIIDDTSYILSGNDVFLFYPGKIYSACSQTETCEFIYAHFDFTIGASSRALDNFAFDGYVPIKAAVDEIRGFIENFRIYKNNGPLSFYSLKGYLTILLSKIIVYKCAENSNIYSPVSAKNNLSRLHVAFDYISSNMDRLITIKELADLVNMSEKYFITYFKNSIGITPSKYITQQKMNKALIMIFEQKYTIKQIGNFLGFSDQYAFSKAFKNYYGTAPSRIYM